MKVYKLVLAGTFGILSLLAGAAQAFNLPDTGEPHPAFAKHSYETQILVFNYTAYGNMADTTYRGAGAVMLSDGSSQDLGSLYKPKNKDVEAFFITKLKQGEWKEDRLYQVNLLWGGSTGQESEKMYVQASAKIGFMAKIQTSEASMLTISAQTTIGGALKERACTADYGVAGSHQVKCSMASSAMAPSETLKYLSNRSVHDATQVKVTFQWFFN